VAFIKQVPDESAVRVAFAAVELKAQFVAFPPLTIEYVTAPVPEPLNPVLNEGTAE
jgi:hypothetical protein